MSELLPSRQSFLRETVLPLTQDYQPNDAVKALAKTHRVATLVGPSGVGKNTVLNRSGLAVATSQTTRMRRPSDTTEYRTFFDIDAKHGREDLVRRLSAKQFIQCACHPTTGEFYGREPEDFPQPVVAMDVLAQEYVRMRRADLFESTLGVCVVTRNFKTWDDRFIGRGDKLSPDLYVSRMAESGQSLKTCLGIDSMVFLINDEPDEAGRTLKGLAEGTISPRQIEDGRYGAELMLRGIVERGYLDDAA